VPGRGTILTQTSGTNSGAAMGVDFVNTTTSAALIYGFRTTVLTFENAETVEGFDKDGNAITLTLNAAEVAPDPPHYYNWTPYANDTTTYGSMPDRATIGALYRGRPTLSGNPDNPHQWYMARQNNPYDWNYGTLDAQSAVAGSNADAGEIGGIITALIPYKDDYLLFGATTSVWRMNGDPAAGGRLVEVSLTTGIFGANSWTFDDQENLSFLGNGGVFQLPPQVGITPVDITQELIPDFWSDWALDASIHTVTMAYDKLNHGILMCKTLLADGTNENYWIDTRTKGFFPESYPTNSGVYYAYYYDAIDPAFQSLILGTTGSYLKQFDAATLNDDTGASTQAIDSFVVFGAILAAANGDSKARLTLASHTLSADSSAVISSIFTHHTAEQLIDGIDDATLSPVIVTTITPTTRPVRRRQRARGTYFAVRLQNAVASQTWGLESFTINVEPSGRF